MATDVEEIGIVGIGCRFPGANDIHEFWKLLENGENHVKDIPKERWDNDKIYSEAFDEPGKIYVKKAGLLTEHDKWDNRLFGISDLEGVRIDPQQSYVLECTHMALEDGGFTREQISGTNTGVFIGVMNDDYKSLMGTDHSADTNFTATGLSTTVIASRVSYVYNLHGPCMTIDTACSSAMMAMHLGCQAIRAGECDLAICGGVSSILSPDMFLPLCKARMLSKVGQCQTFCDTADGYARGEGCGIVILQSTKRPTKVKNLWGILQTGINQDGRATSPMTAPSSKQQQKLLHSVYGKYKVNPKDLDYIEVHGTGTPIGDPTEIDAISTFIKAKLQETNDSDLSRKILMGSVKTNIGHTESAAAVAGIIKVLLMMRYGKIIKSLHIKEDKSNLNKRVKLEDTILDISVRTAEWPKNQFGNRVGCVNSFGFGGSNGHAVIKQCSESLDVHEDDEEAVQGSYIPHFVCIFGRDKTSLSRNVEGFIKDTKTFQEKLNNCSYTSLLYRDKHEHRTLLYGTTLNDIHRSAHFESYKTSESVHGQKQNLVFVFCGVGTAWPKMGAEMMKKHKVFQQTVKKVSDYMKIYSNCDVEQILTCTDNYSDPFLNHVAIFTVQVAFYEVWKSLGVVPDTIIGQSVGEVAAAYASGAINLSSAVKVIYHRSKILAQMKGGAMTVIGNVPLSQIENRCLMSKYDDSLNIAVYNSPSSCTVSGSETAVKELERDMSSCEGAFIRSLNVVCAYHSRFMDDCLKDITSALTNLESSIETDIPQISTVTGKLVEPKELISAGYWAQNVRKPVMFMQAIGMAAKDHCRNVYLEIGPRQVLRTHLPNILGDKQKYICLPSMNLNDESCMYNSLTAMFELGMDINLSTLVPKEGRLTSLPRYHFNRTCPLFVSSLSKQYLSGLSNSMGAKHYVEKVNEESFKILISQETTPFVFDHQLLGHVTVPGATYVEAVIASSSEVLKSPPDILELSVSFENPCMVEKGPTTVLNVSFKQMKGKENKYLEYNVSVNQRTLCNGHVSERKPIEYYEINVKALKMCLTKSKSSNEIYDVLEKIGLTYGDSLRLIKECYFTRDECISIIHIPICIRHDVKNYTIHPAIVDAMLQASGVLSNDVNSRSFAGIPKGFKTLKVYTAMQENMLVYTKLTKMTRKNSYYTSILCTEKGTIVAEMTDLIIRTMDTSIPNDYISYDLNWFKHEMSQDFMWKDTYMNNEVMIVFGSKRFKRWISKGNFSFTFHEIPDDQNKFKQVATEVLRHCKKGQKLVFAPCMNCNDILDLVNVDVYNIIKSNANSLKTIFNIKQSSVDTTPVFVVTEMTQQLSPKLQEKTNFLGAELWGFTRSAMTEMPSEDIRLIDVDLQVESIQPFVSLVVNTENIVLESLIRNGYIYGNEIRPSITQDIATIQTSISECSTPISLYSNSSDGVSDPFLAAANRILEKNGVQGDNVNIKVSTVYINRNDMMTTKSSISFFSSNPGIEIKTNEFVGWIQRGKKEDRNLKKDDDIYVVCFPVTVSTVLTVPTSCCLNLKDTPFYTPGLISETVILWKIRKQVKPNSNALIVVSDTNCWRAKILSRLFEYHKSKGKIASWQELTSLSTNERYSHAVVLQFENTSNICMLNSIIGLQNVICVNSWLPWDAASFFMQNIVHADVLTLRSENILSEKCCMKLVPKVLKYLKTDSDFFEKTLPRELTEGSLSVISVLYSSVDVQSISMETKIPVILYPSSCFKKDGYYIFVGGTSGLGWELLQYCAQLGAGNLVTFSRRGLTKEKKTEMERIESLYRCNIQHIRADITDIDSLQNGFNILRNKNAKVKGIFNGAGVLKDTLLNKMTTEDLETVLRPKVLGTLNLHRVSKDFALDYFVTHSSITAIFGNPGQCNYAAGNSFQDSFAFFRSSHGLCAQSINWGALQVGMARESGPDFENRFRRQGIHILNDKDVRTCFNEIVLTKDIQKMFGIFDWQRFIQNPIYTSAHYKFRRILQETGLIQQEKPIQSSDIILRDDFHKLPSEKKKENLTNVIQLTLTESLMVEKESLLPGTSLYKLGIDSMSAMSISNCLHQYTSIRVPVVFLLSNTTSIEGLVSFLLRELEARGVDENTLEEEPINYDILDGSVTFMQGSILNCLDTDKPENFIRSICYEVKLKRTSVRKWVQIITTLLNLHPGLRQIFFWDPVEKRFQAKEIEINKFNVPIDIVSFENIFEQSNPEQLDPRNHIPVKFHLACKERTTRMKLFLHAVVVDMQSINVLFRDLEICARHHFLGEELPDIQRNHVAETVRLALTPMFKDMQSFWKRQFSLSVEPFSFSSYELKTLQEENWREIGHVFSDDQFDNIISFTRNEKITLYNCVLSVYFLCIHELTGREYIPLITNTNIRGFIPALENVLSRCINEVPVIGRVQSKITISQYLQEMALQLNMVTEHGAYPFELIRQDIKSENLQQNIGRHRFIIDDISNVSMQSVKKDVTVKVTAVRHRRHNYETCLFVYHNMKGKTLSLDLGFNSESFSMSRAHLMLGRLEFLMNQLTSCDMSISVEELLRVENMSLDIITDCKKNQTKETFVFEDFLSKSTSHTNISNRFTEKSRKNTEMSHGSTKTIMLGDIEKQSATGNVYDIKATLQEMKTSEMKSEYYLCWTYLKNDRLISLDAITEMHMKKMGGRYCLLLKNGVKGWLQFNAKTYPQARSWFDQLKSAIQSSKSEGNSNEEHCHL